MTYGFECWNVRGCRNEIAAPTREEAEQAVYDAGWQIGLVQSGQAYYSCPDCANALFATNPLFPTAWNGEPPRGAPSNVLQPEREEK